jgi:hypothetical protein
MAAYNESSADNRGQDCTKLIMANKLETKSKDKIC